MKTLEELLESLPEEHRDAAKGFYDNLTKRLGYDRRQGERVEKDLAKAQERIAELEQANGSMGEATAKIKALEADLKVIAAQRDELLPLKAEHEQRRLIELIGEKVKLGDPAYLDHVIRVTGVQLVAEKKDGKVVHALNPEGAAALDAWAQDPANQHRLARGNGSAPPHRTTAPPAQTAGPGKLLDPIRQAQLDRLPPASRERVLRNLQQLQQQ